MPFAISGGWKIQDQNKISQNGAELSKAGFSGGSWMEATVPGTVLTSLVNNKVYPEPLYGENNRPDRIPESLCRTSYWYRTEFSVPADYAGKNIFLNFEGINYSAEVWVNGQNLGPIRGAFTRGVFDVTKWVAAGQKAALAVLVTPQPNPGEPHEHTQELGMGQNGGITAIDGPTFLCSLGWDWIPAIRDRNTGIWQKVFLSATGPVEIKDPLVTTDLPLPKLDSADIAIQATLRNHSDELQKVILKGSFGTVSFEQPFDLPPRASRLLSFDSKAFSQLHLSQPKLWWPNGYGPQNLHDLELSVEAGGTVSDTHHLRFGIRKFSYEVPETENLTISVNGVKVFCRGGNWGMDEAMKRIPRERLEAQIRMHQQANYTMIRNWVGQSTSADFYELCDQYGMLLWDEFFQPNPSDGPNPTDLATYIANVREKILRFRNHACVAVWCGRNEGHPPKEIDDLLTKLMAELEPTRHYQSSSTDGKGVESGGPYFWRAPKAYFDGGEPFKTEIGSMSVPTLESVQGMMPEKDWEIVNDDWAEHDFARGAQGGDSYLEKINARYGKSANLADFVRKAQLANYEAHRALYEGRHATLFHPSSGALLWMSNPAQPSFVWQIYHHDLEPNASLFGSRKGCEMLHIQLNEKDGSVELINHHPTALSGAKAKVSVVRLDGSSGFSKELSVNAPPSSATKIGPIDWPAGLSEDYFVALALHDSAGKLISDNFYWKAPAADQDNFQGLNKLETVTLDANIFWEARDGKCLLRVDLHNSGKQVALMAHLQLRRQKSMLRVLPVYYSDNYVSLLPGETRSISIEASLADLQGETPFIAVDGWNVGIKEFSSDKVALGLNKNAQVSSWPVTGLPRAALKP